MFSVLWSEMVTELSLRQLIIVLPASRGLNVEKLPHCHQTVTVATPWKWHNVTMAVFKIHNHHGNFFFIIKMHYISCFLNLFWRGGGGGNNWNSYYDLCKNKNKNKTISYKTRSNAVSFCGRKRRHTRWPPFKPPGPASPTPKFEKQKQKQKYHAINSVYYISPYRFYITFLSIHVHRVIHIVLFVSFSLDFFHG